MSESKRKLIMSLQQKAKLYYSTMSNTTERRRLRNIDMELGCNRVIWMVIEKGYTWKTACRLVSKKFKYCYFDSLRNDVIKIIPQSVRTRTTKIHQYKFFKELEYVK